MRLFVPAFDALWKGSKASLHNSTRAVFLKLCQEARDAERGGSLVLPRAKDDAAALGLLCPGTRAEFELALREMMDTDDPMIAITDDGGRRVLQVLSWDDWALMGRTEQVGTIAPSPRRGGRPRKWATEADRKRAARASGNSDGSVSGNLSGRPETCPETRPETFPDASGNQFTDNGGVRGGDQIRSDQKKAEKNEESAREGAAPHPAEPARGAVGGQLALIPGEVADAAPDPSAPSAKPSPRRRATPPSPVTEVQTAWRAEWTAAGMPGPAPWDAAAAAVTKAYLEAPGGTVETARLAIVGMLRTPAGDWHRTEANGRHLNIPAALAGKHVVAFTTAGAAWLEAQREATRPRRQPPPPAKIPDFDEIKRQQQERLAQIRRPTETT